MCIKPGGEREEVSFVSLEHLGKKPGFTKVIGKTPIKLSWAELSFLIPVKPTLGKGVCFLILVFTFHMAYKPRRKMAEANKLLFNCCLDT